MGKIPDQVLKQEAEAEANLAADMAEATNAQTTQAETPQADPTPAPSVLANAQTPEANADASQSLLEAARGGTDDLELQRAKSTLGRARKLKEEADSKVAEYEGKMHEMQAEIERLRTSLSEAESNGKKFEAQSKSDILDSLVKKLNANGGEYSREDAELMLTSFDAAFGEKFKKLEDQLSVMASEKSQSRLENFISEVERNFPGFEEMDRRHDAKWTSFLDSRLPEPMSEFTYRQVAADAIGKCDTKKMLSVLRAFQNAGGANFSEASNPSRDYGNLRPNSVAGGNKANGRANNPQMFRRSAVEQFRRAYLNKRFDVLGMSQQDAARTMDAIEDAEANGFIDERS